MLKGARIGDDAGREEALNWQAGTTRRGELEPNKADAEQIQLRTLHITQKRGKKANVNVRIGINSMWLLF